VNLQMGAKWIAGTLVATMAAATTLGFCGSARADAGDLPTTPVNLTLTDAPAQSALAMIFKSAHVSYTLPSSIGGTITMDLQNVPFDAALRSALKMCTPPMQARFEDGMFEVSPKVQAVSTPEPPIAGSLSNGQTGSLRPPEVNQIIALTGQGELLVGELGQSPADYEVIKLKYADAATIANVFAPLPGQAPNIIVPPTLLENGSPTVSSPAAPKSGVISRSGSPGVTGNGGLVDSTPASGMPTI